MTRPSVQGKRATVVIDCDALKHNLLKLKKLSGNASIMAVIKADGYGHGMEAVARALGAADELAVSDQFDLHRLRSMGIEKKVTLLSARFDLNELIKIAEQNARPTIYDVSQIEVFEQLTERTSLSVWLKVDTGMGRLGLPPEEVKSALQRLRKIAAIKEISLMTHLANADNVDHPANIRQFKTFNEISGSYTFAEISILNSAGLLNFPSKSMSVVRPGIMLYGISPLERVIGRDLDLRTVMTFQSKLISIKTLPKGATIGYGSDHVLKAATRVGIISVGYADGYPRHAPPGTPVLINGERVPLIGRVSMDMLAVDLDQLPAKVGDTVILWGKGNPIENIASAAGTIPYTLCSGILPRVSRVII